ncbi:MAG: DNA-directed RNA polymerase subunit omega [Planctomycetaceae bacterium]|nr:MAG: DNA-directed RNA polymerase subunit omega [Planctomycetaceae bacterium]
MIEELKEEQIVNKVGGRFKLSTLIQKRMVQLNRGGVRPLLDNPANSQNLMETVIQEIMQDKIFLDTAGRLVVAGETQPDDGDGDAGPSLDDVR